MFPPCYLPGAKLGWSNEDNGDLLQKVPSPDPAAGHRRPTPLPETPGSPQASLGRSPVGPLLLSPGSWCTQGSLCARQESVSQSCGSSGGSMVGLMATSSKRPLPHPGLLHLSPRPAAGPCRPAPPQEALRQLWLSLRGVPGAHKFCLSLLSISGGYGV